MRKLMLPLLCLLLLSGCAKTQVKPNVTMFSCDFAARYRDVQITGELVRGESGVLSMSLEQPNTLRGVTVSLENGELVFSLGDLRYAYRSELRETALLRLLLRSLDDACVRIVNGDEIAGETDGFRYTVVIDPATGNPVSLQLPDKELSVQFSDIQKLG